MASLKFCSAIAFALLLCLVTQITLTIAASEGTGADPIEQPEKSDEKKETTTEKPVAGDYAKNSLCGYCKYCKFCSLCETDCPCTDPSRVGCDMCGYCKYCRACKLCDTFCPVGGFLDTLSSSLLSSVGNINLDSVEKDIAKDPKIKEYL